MDATKGGHEMPKLDDLLKAVRGVYDTVGSPGGFGYETAKGKALAHLYTLFNMALAADGQIKREEAVNTSRISWMAAQQDLTINTFELLGGGTVVEIMNLEQDVIGRGDTLEQALDDAMGRG